VSLCFEFTKHYLNEEGSELGERTWHPAPAVPGAQDQPERSLSEHGQADRKESAALVGGLFASSRKNSP